MCVIVMGLGMLGLMLFGSGDGGRRVIEETFNANTRRPCTTYFFRYLSYCILLLDCKIII